MEMPIPEIDPQGDRMRLIRPATGEAFHLKKGKCLSVIDVEGQQVSDLFCVSALDKKESLSCARSLDYADKLFLSAGDLLYSNRSQVMLTILKDSCGRHDLLMPPCSLKMFQNVANDPTFYHPSCHENLVKNLEAFGVTPDDISNTFNIFMHVKVSEQGEVKIESPLSQKMDSISLRAEMDLIVGLTACAHKETNAGRLKSIGYLVENFDEP